ncbi:MAG: hydroxysqualene dehydroxylase HpnE [Pseudomonadota bacterium]|nr:hydroxysqualene dehydroxylase HpnE [Pseudomonadota bacterium]
MAMVHIIGAGMAGLSCAVKLAEEGREIAIYETAAHAGGRARSFMDDSLGCLIDNGSHMLMGGCEATREYLSLTGSGNMITEVTPAAYPFLDLATGERWRLRPSDGRLPLWLFSADRRVPGSTLSDYKDVLHIARAGPEHSVADRVDTRGVLYDRLWQPLSRAVLNTDASEGSAQTLWRMIRETLLRGEAASRPFFFHRGLSPALVDPALKKLKRHGVEIRMKARLRGLGWHDYHANALVFSEGRLRVAPEDSVVLAVPPDICADIWPEVVAPTQSRAIVNAHFRLDQPIDLPWDAPFLGLVNAESQWLFTRDNILSVTISAADRLVDQPAWELANMLWTEIAHVLDRNLGRVPPWRIIKERRATFAQTPAQIMVRPKAETILRNMFLAGDWTATGLPATIESAVKSGFDAARLVLDSKEVKLKK